MNDKFDELAKGLAQSGTRRQALKKFGVGLAGIALACFGVAAKAGATKTCLPDGHSCSKSTECCSGACVKFYGYASFRHRICHSTY